MSTATAYQETEHEARLMSMIERLEGDKEALLNELYPNPISVQLDDGAFMPEKAHASDAGFDLRCIESGEIQPGDRRVIATGVHVAIESGWYGRVAPRSGLAVREGVDVLAGVVDSGYTDQIGVVLINTGTKPYAFEVGDRIAQLVIERIFTGELRQVEALDSTARGKGGYGSTGR